MSSVSHGVRVLAAVLFSLVVGLLFASVGLVVTRAIAADGEIQALAITADPTSDSVAATAAEFRVDESGAATYSVPLYGVPGTAGVSPKLALNYSSQGSYGPIGKGWSIGGLSTISRCRATREAGDFIVGGVVTDGNPAPVNYTSSDRYCLDGQRLIPAPAGSAACKTVGGMTATNLRTEIESFQRVCAYTPTSGTTGVAFFTVERKDGSTSWYGDRAVSSTPDASYNGYFNSTVPGKTGFALAWAQTRFQDSTGNYIDFVYYKDADAIVGEHLIREVRYTGKVALAGQTTTLAPYARILFTYSLRSAATQGKGYQGGGLLTQGHRLESISACASLTTCAGATQARFYKLTYAASSSGSPLDTLTQLQECRDSTMAVCLAPTTFAWSPGKYEFATVERPPNLPTGSLEKFEGFKLGDVDGDGRQDIVYLKDEGCSTEWLYVLYGITDGNGNPNFTQSANYCTPSELHAYGEGSWHLIDYNGDGRDDLFVRGASTWAVYASQGRAGNMNFLTGTSLISALSPAIPAQSSSRDQIQLADVNGDGLTDIVYPNGSLRVRLMERTGPGNAFGWGPQRSIVVDMGSLGPSDPRCSQSGWLCERYLEGASPKIGFSHLADFNGDAASDLIIGVNEHVEQFAGGGCIPAFTGASAGGDEDSLGLDEGEEVLPYRLQASNAGLASAASTDCVIEDISSTHAFVVTEITSTTVKIASYAKVSGAPHSSALADANGDGLTEWFYRPNSASNWFYRVNTGTGMQAAVEIPLLDFQEQTRFIDVNGDGRADVLHPFNAGAYKAYNVKFALPAGGFGAEGWLPGGNGTNGNALLCEGVSCDENRKVPMFADFDGDGNVDFMSLKMDNNADVFLSRSTSRFSPRDAITRFTNGFGAETDVSYAPLTNAALYRRGSASRDTHNWGRGAPVLDFLAPIYAVARAASSSPQASDPTAKATLHYRYAGGKVQAGGRGFLGFSEVVTIDPNQIGGYVTTTTLYSQNFPFVGMPASTIKRAEAGATYAAPPCLNGVLNDTCYATPGSTFLPPSANWFADSHHDWEGDTDSDDNTEAPVLFTATAQLPIHVRTKATQEKVRDPFEGTQTSQVVTSFKYGAYGNVLKTTAETFTGTSATAMATVATLNVYGSDNPAEWRLGRLTRTDVTHSRPSRVDVVRTTTFGYAMAAPYTGLLNGERVQWQGGADKELLKEFVLDQFGNRTAVETCAAPATACDTSIVFHPATPTNIERYSRTVFDAAGRYPLATYEPFWTASGGTERKTQDVLARNIFGDITEALDLNGVRAMSVPGALGRPYYTWVQTVAGATAGEPTHGREAWTTYRWCGTGPGQVNCPNGGRFRQKSVAEAAPTTWTYYDVLGRPILKAEESFNVGVSGKDVAAVCTTYDRTGKPSRVSNPFFLAGTGGADGPTGLATVCSDAGRRWTTTVYDVLGRPTDVTSPNDNEPGGVAVSSTTYIGNSTLLTDARGKETAQTRNGMGELITVTDAHGLVTTYGYHADGTSSYVQRNAGRGLVQNLFYSDVLGRKVQQNDPDAGVTTYEYNALGELTAQVDAAGNRIENEIDARGRVWRKTVRRAAGTIESQATFTYDTAANGAGQLASETITGTYTDWVVLAGSNPQFNLALTRTNSFDTLGRPLGTTTTIDGANYTAAAQYDSLGRVWKAQDASGQWVKTQFNGRGMASHVCSSTSTDVVTTCPADANLYLQSLETDDWGHVIRERRGNHTAMEVTRTYKPDTGRTWSICAGNTSCNLMNEGYGWDANGSLITHQKETRYVETFEYDDLNRLLTSRLISQNGAMLPSPVVTQEFEYDALGNICRARKFGVVRNYTYLGAAGCGLGGAMNSSYGGGGVSGFDPHQVASTVRDPQGASMPTNYTWDPRGNQLDETVPGIGGGRFIHYSLDDKAYEIGGVSRTAPTSGTRFWYGPDGARYKRVEINNGTKTLYLGNVEIVVAGATTTIKRTVAGVLLQTIVGATTTNYYLFHDELGSLVRITNASGSATNNMDYAAYGERRSYTDRFAYGTAPGLSNRGFTSQEHVGNDVIHLNARLYDPDMGRFLQVDPLVQAPSNPQSWNAYTYAFNNPLTYTDPTGMMGATERQWLGVVVAVVGTIFFPYTANWWVKLGYAVALGAASGYASTGTTQGALYGAFSGALFWGIGTYFQHAGWAQATAGNNAFGSGLTWGGYGAKVLAHGTAGGVTSRLQGGRFGDGFVAAGVVEAFSPAISGIGNGARSYAPARVAAAAIVGGTASVIAGGKFGNGAVSGALAQAFNSEAHPGMQTSEAGEEAHAVPASSSEADLIPPRSVFAADSGIVELIGWQNPNDHREGFGYRIRIRHYDGTYTVYAHIDPQSVQVSAQGWVYGGRRLGSYASPANGSATGPHLHFEYRGSNGETLDGASFLETVMPNHVIKSSIDPRRRHPVLNEVRPHRGYDLVEGK